MTKPKAKPSQRPHLNPALIVFGLSEDKKPRAGTFLESEIDIASKAATALGLTAIKIDNRVSRDVLANIRSGRVHARGPGFVPPIGSNLYEQLKQLAKSPGTTPKGGVEREQSAVSPNSAQLKENPLVHLPKSWDDIAVGDLVLAQDTDPKEGWWQAIVVHKNGDIFSLRWQQSASRKAFSKHKYNLALIWPGKDLNPAASNASSSAYPASWQAIALNHVVLAKEDGPMQQWWEANPIEAKGDEFTLRWRDHPALPTIVRPRLALALVHSNPAAGRKTSTAA